MNLYCIEKLRSISLSAGLSVCIRAISPAITISLLRECRFHTRQSPLKGIDGLALLA